jgi:hypothetical protein
VGCGGQSGNGAGFPRVLRFPPPILLPISPSTLTPGAGTIGLLVTEEPSGPNWTTPQVYQFNFNFNNVLLKTGTLSFVISQLFLAHRSKLMLLWQNIEPTIRLALTPHPNTPHHTTLQSLRHTAECGELCGGFCRSKFVCSENLHNRFSEGEILQLKTAAAYLLTSLSCTFLLTYLLMYGAEPFLRSCQLCSHSGNSQQF